MKKFLNILLVLTGVLLATGCDNAPDALDVRPAQVVGYWQKNGTHEYWHYRADSTGAKWDADEGFSEDFPSYSFEWSVSGNRLTHVVRGEEIDVPITRIYIITDITSTYMDREEELATYRLNKIES